MGHARQLLAHPVEQSERNRHVQRRELGRTLECPAEFVVHDRGSD